MIQTIKHVPGLERLMKLAKINSSGEQFIRDIQKFPSWYLQNDFLRRQAKPYFLRFFEEYKKRG